MSAAGRPIVVVGAGPVGLIAALGLAHHGLPALVLEEDATLSVTPKAGTVLSRTVEILDRYGAAEPVLRAALRVDEIGDLDRATNARRESIFTGVLAEDTRFPFVVNIPQHALEPVLRDELERRVPGCVRMNSRVVGFEQHEDHVVLEVETEGGRQQVEADYVLACDGGRSRIRDLMGVTVEGHTLDERYMLVDLRVDLDVANARDYPYLSYFGDPDEWVILVRQPTSWRIIYPLPADAPEPTRDELVEKARRFIGAVDEVEVLGSSVYAVHHRVATHWRDGRVFLLGDAAHLITPMWALGLNTGALDASNLPWRLAWVARGWARPELLDGYEAEQAPLAIRGSGEMAEAARAYMDRRAAGVAAMGSEQWGNAITRTLLGVRLDVNGSGDWSLVRTGAEPGPLAVGDRMPDARLFGPDGGEVHVHELVSDGFAALCFADPRRRPSLPADVPGLRCHVVSRWDAPHDGGLRERALLDPAGRLQQRLAVADGAVVLVRPDGHVAAIGAGEATHRLYGDAVRLREEPR